MENQDFQDTLRSLVTAEGPVDFRLNKAQKADNQKGEEVTQRE